MDERAVLPSGARVHRDARRLVHHEQVLVRVAHDDPFDMLGLELAHGPFRQRTR